MQLRVETGFYSLANLDTPVVFSMPDATEKRFSRQVMCYTALGTMLSVYTGPKYGMPWYLTKSLYKLVRLPIRQSSLVFFRDKVPSARLVEQSYGTPQARLNSRRSSSWKPATDGLSSLSHNQNPRIHTSCFSICCTLFAHNFYQVCFLQSLHLCSISMRLPYII